MGSRASLSIVCLAMLITAGCASDTDTAQPAGSSETSALSSDSYSAPPTPETDAKPTSSTTPQAASTANEPSPEATPEVYDWSAALVGGGSIDLSGYANSAVVLWFWSPY